jgi:hypothetical protein
LLNAQRVIPFQVREVYRPKCSSLGTVVLMSALLTRTGLSLAAEPVQAQRQI